MKQLRALFLLVIIITTSVTVQAKKVRLKHKLIVGTEFFLQHTLTQEINQEIMGQVQIITNTITTRYLFKILEKTTDGHYLMEDQIDGMKVVLENNFMNMEYDSDKDKDPPAELKTMIAGMHIPVKFILSTSGEIIEVTDAEQFLNQMKKALGADENPMAQMLSGLSDQFTSIEGLKDQLGNLFLKYPEGKIKLREPWTVESESMQMVKLKNITKNTLVEADKKSATIKQVVIIEQMKSSEGIEMDGMTMTYELSGRKDAGYQVDLASGLIIKADAMTNISGIIAIESPQMASPMSIPLTIKMTETIELLQ